MTYSYFIGLDVGKDSFDAACHGRPHRKGRFANSAKGFAQFAKAFAAELADALVVVEATGGYENALVEELLAAGISVHRASPAKSSHFARSLRPAGGKTDALDAAALARYGAERWRELRLAQPLSPEAGELARLVARRGDLVDMRAGEKARADHPGYAEMKASLAKVIKVLSAEIDRLEAAIARIVRDSQTLSARMKIMTGVKGIGATTAAALLVHMPELGQLHRREAASLAGLAPHPRDSGRKQGYRPTTGGRTVVKRALFLAAMAAARYNPAIKPFYQRLRANGKRPMVAIVAVMRKLITILNAKIRDEACA